MPVVRQKHFDKMSAYAEELAKGEPSIAEVMKLASIAAESMQSFCASMDATMVRELREIAEYIETMRSEVGVFQANELKESRIPAAGQELDAIIRATEDATNTIMESAEAILCAGAETLDDYRAVVTDHVMRIFESCSFQDITGQRVAKVVETLQTIETRVSRFVDAVQAQDMSAILTDEDRAKAERREKLILNGPQLAGSGIDQSKVDELLGR